MKEKFYDRVGNEIDVGDRVAYAAGGKRGGMRVGQIVRKELRHGHYTNKTEYAVLCLQYKHSSWRSKAGRCVGISLTTNTCAINVIKYDARAVDAVHPDATVLGQ